MTFYPADPEPSREALRDARHLSLVWVPQAAGAVNLVSAIVPLVVAGEAATRGNQRGASGLAKLRGAVGAIVGGLLHRWSGEDPALAFRSLHADAFTGSTVSVRQFRAAMGALVQAGLVGTRQGISFQSEGASLGAPKATSRKAGRYWPTDALLAMATAHGLTPENVRAALRSVPSTKAPIVRHPLELLTLGTSSRDPRDRLLVPIRADDARATALRKDVEAHNAMAADWEVEGCCPPRWFRSFRGDWSLHGRWYALGADGAYQTMPESGRVADIRLNGEEVVEIDIGASHLSIVLALAGCPLAPGAEPYAVPGVPRKVVKQWIVATLGKGSPVVRTPLGKASVLAGLDLKAVAAAILAVHPVLEQPAKVVPRQVFDRHGASLSAILPHYLTALEAGALTDAMRALREVHGVLSLPMHDGLIVPRSAVRVAQAAMVDAFERLAGFTPVLTVETKRTEQSGGEAL